MVRNIYQARASNFMHLLSFVVVLAGLSAADTVAASGENRIPKWHPRLFRKANVSRSAAESAKVTASVFSVENPQAVAERHTFSPATDVLPSSSFVKTPLPQCHLHVFRHISKAAGTTMRFIFDKQV